jgi:hypothetical protein
VLSRQRGEVYYHSMERFYEIALWDLQGFGGRNNNPVSSPIETITELARLIHGPADDYWAVQDGKRRGLTADEKTELWQEITKLHPLDAESPLHRRLA